MRNVLFFTALIGLIVPISSAHASSKTDIAVTDKNACRMLTWEYAVFEMLGEWWRASGVDKRLVRKKLTLRKSAADYFCRHSGSKAMLHFYQFLWSGESRVDAEIIRQQADASKIQITAENYRSVTQHINETAMGFLALRFDRCGGGPVSFQGLGSYLMGSNTSGIDVSGHAVPGSPPSRVDPLSTNSSGYSNGSVCSNNGGSGGSGGGNGFPTGLQPDSAKNATSCYVQTTSKSGCDDGDGPAPALDPTTAILFPGALVGDGSTTAAADKEKAQWDKIENNLVFLQASMSIAALTVQVGVRTGLFYTTLATPAMPLSVVLLVGTAIITNAHAIKIALGVDKNRYCPSLRGGGLYTSPITGHYLSKTDMFASCSNWDCSGVSNTFRCGGLQERIACHVDPAAIYLDTCAALLQSDRKSLRHQYTLSSLFSRFCAIVTCPYGQTASVGTNGCECSPSSQSRQGAGSIIDYRCWFSSDCGKQPF